MSKDKDSIINDDLNNIFNKTKNLLPEIKNKNIFLSGGTGFFGTWLIKSFIVANQKLKLNSKLFILTRNINHHKNIHPELHNIDSVKYIEGDIRNFYFPKIDCHYIIHSATTNARETFKKQNPIIKYDVIVNGTKRILDFATECNCEKFLLTSSGSCYGNIPSDISKISEDYNGAPLTIDQNFDYSVLGEAKRMSELLTNIYSKNFKIKTKIARCFSFVGPYMPLDIHYAIGNFMRDIIKNKSINILGDGKQVRSYMYVSDLIVWLLTILLKGKNNSIYNVGSEENITIHNLAKKISKLSLQNIDIKIHDQLSNNINRAYTPSTQKIQNELKVTQEINLENAIIKTLSHIDKNKKYYNI